MFAISRSERPSARATEIASCATWLVWAPELGVAFGQDLCQGRRGLAAGRRAAGFLAIHSLVSDLALSVSDGIQAMPHEHPNFQQPREPVRTDESVEKRPPQEARWWHRGVRSA